MSGQTSIKRIMTTVVSCLLALGLVVGIAGCGKNDEELIRASVAEVMDLFKNPTEENLKPWMDKSELDLSVLDEYGVDIYEFMGHLFGHFDYKIDDVKVEGDTAAVDLTLTNADIEDAVQKATEEITGNLADYADLLTSENGEKDFMKVYFDKIYEILDASDKMVTKSTSMKLDKVDGEWNVDDSSMEDVISAMYGGMSI